MSHPTDPTCDILYGLLALQTGLIDQGALRTAFAAWTHDKGRPMADHLVNCGELDPEDSDLVTALVAKHLKKHDGDPEKSLATVNAGRSTRESLAALCDVDIEATLAHVGADSTSTYAREDGDRTTNGAMATATTDGQRFRLLRHHASGGLGAVFVALDDELNREVALKQILERHADDPTSRERFVIEAEVTGGLEHPGIVPVYGLGTYGDGRPYYAMRFIRGDSLKDVIDQFHADQSLKKSPGQRTLELRKLLRRFTDVCNAIDYAHARGVLHRDIKPANIIMGSHGETLVVDWGLAKVLGRSQPGSIERALVPKSSSSSSETLPGSAMGTPAYMSPEQARGDLDHLGPHSDVYSLGATLYVLLTGKTPLEGSDIGAVLRAAQEGKFPPPRKHDPSIDKALEAVCLKAMALAPENRYTTPRALADDLERWMADEPVSAWREPWSRSLMRWLTRHRTGVTAVGAALLMALAGLAAVLGVQTRANAQLTAKNDQLNESVKREAERFNLAMDAIKLFHGDVSEDLLLKEKSFEKLRAKLLRGAAGFYGKLDQLLAGQSDDASRAALGKAYSELGKLTGDIGTESDAIAMHHKALAVRRELAQRAPGSAEAALDLARTLTDIGNLHTDPDDLAGAIEPLKEAQGLADNVEASGQRSDAGQYVLARAVYGQGVKLMRSSDPANAMKLFEKATEILQALFDANSDNADFQWGLASALDGQAHLLSDPHKALALYRRELVIREKLAVANPDGSGYQNALAIVHNNIAGRLEELGRMSESVASARRAVAIWQAAAEAYPAVTSVQSNVSFGLFGLGQALSNLGRWDEALAAFLRAKVILQRQVALDPTQAANKRGLATVLARIGSLLQQTGHPNEALVEFEQELLVRNELAKGGNSRAQNSLASCEVNKALAQLALGRPGEARASCDRAILVREDLIKANPENTEFRSGLAESLLRSGQVRRSTGDTVGAAADWRRAIVLYEGLPPRSGEIAMFEACCHAMLSGVAGIAGSGISASDGEFQAERAMEILHRTVAGGYRGLALWSEIALDPLRDRPDFRALMMDLAFPTEPFAQ